MKNYAQSEVLRCAATIRPSYCKYKGNICCFNCEDNDECMEKALNEHLMKPCRNLIPIKIRTGKFKYVRLFGEEDLCEFSI